MLQNINLAYSRKLFDNLFIDNVCTVLSVLKSAFSPAYV